jgi:PAS domain S-box-containing protein
MSELDGSLLNATATFMMVLDGQGRILVWNLACSEVTEYAHDEVLGRCPWDLLAISEDIWRANLFHAWSGTSSRSPVDAGGSPGRTISRGDAMELPSSS